MDRSQISARLAAWQRYSIAQPQTSDVDDLARSVALSLSLIETIRATVTAEERLRQATAGDDEVRRTWAKLRAGVRR